jgi:hypothetical protein
LQHRKLCAAISENIYYNIAKSTMKHEKWDHSENICCNNPKITLQHSKIIHCNIAKKTHCNPEEIAKGRTNSKGDGFKVQSAPALAELAGGRRKGPQSSHRRVPQIQRRRTRAQI